MIYVNFIDGNNNNEAFSTKVRDNCQLPFNLLRKQLRENKIILNNPALNQNRLVSLNIHIDLKNNINLEKKNILVLWETAYINKYNRNIFKKKIRNKFDKILTWESNLVNLYKFNKYNIPHAWQKIENNLKKREKNIIMICSNKFLDHNTNNNGYNKRLEIINFFENKKNFKFFGYDWQFYPATKNKFLFILQKKISKILKTNFFIKKNYCGEIKSKKKILKKYLFNICVENIYNEKDYITEKIFDSFFCGCIPIYLGASNILNYIPKNTFINMNDFKNLDEMLTYINNLNDNDIKDYLTNIKLFLKDIKSKKFSPDHFANYFSNLIIKSLNN